MNADGLLARAEAQAKAKAKAEAAAAAKAEAALQAEARGLALSKLVLERQSASLDGSLDLSSIGCYDEAVPALAEQLASAGTSLTTLSLAKNQLTQFPLAALPSSLTQLDLSRNPLNGASVQVMGLKLPSLQTLTLAHAGLTSIPRGLASCNALRSLDLSSNLLGEGQRQVYALQQGRS